MNGAPWRHLLGLPRTAIINRRTIDRHLWRYLNWYRERAAWVFDADGMMHSSRRVGAPVAFDVTGLDTRLYLSKGDHYQLCDHIRAAHDYHHSSAKTVTVHFGKIMIPQHCKIMPYTDKLVLVIGTRIF